MNEGERLKRYALEQGGNLFEAIAKGARDHWPAKSMVAVCIHPYDMILLRTWMNNQQISAATSEDPVPELPGAAPRMVLHTPHGDVRVHVLRSMREGEVAGFVGGAWTIPSRYRAIPGEEVD